MSTERTDPHADVTDPTAAVPEVNGTSGVRLGDLVSEVVLHRARCSNLRHWCRLLLEDPAADGVLPTPVAAELRTTTPEVSEPEGQEVVSLLARGGNVPPTHPLAPAATDPNLLRAEITRLSAERERLRKAFFALYDHLHPGDDLTDEYFLALRDEPQATESISELIDRLERETGGSR